MVYRRWTRWVWMLCLLFMAGVAGAANPMLKQASFADALLKSPMGTDPTQAFFLVGLLKATGAQDEDTEALRRELLHAYAEQLQGIAAMPAGSVGAAIARGRDRSNVLDAPFVSSWQAGYNKGLGILWADGDASTPYFTSVYRGMRPVAKGLWAEVSDTGKTQFMLGLRLVNRSTLPIPIHNPELSWGGEPVTGRGGLGFTCNWDKPVVLKGSFQLDQVLLLMPGEISDAIACEAQPANNYWREKLLANRGMSQPDGPLPLLIAHDFDDARRQRFLELALSELAPQSQDWRLRMQAAKEQVGRRWLPAKHPLEAPVAQKWTISPHAGWAEAGKKLQWFLGATLVTLALFAVGRVMLRSGIPGVAVAIGTVLIGIGLMAFGMKSLGGGTGYDSPFYVGLAIYSAILGPLLLSVLALHKLHQLLDEEDIAWSNTVVRGWTHILNLSSSTSRAEFWGFFAHCVWWWALVHVCLQPLDLWLGSVLLLALISLLVRRLRSMRPSELLALMTTVACLVLLAVLRTH